ncbi:hypothetical protein ACFWMV_35455 [Streptomyces mutabilis]|uniref:hypothetical protein n=1 Tax=Streptomyces mutabilis TaxID=67332 RepID=UPI0036618ABA
MGRTSAGAMGPVGRELGSAGAVLCSTCSGTSSGVAVSGWSFEFWSRLATMRTATRAASAAHCAGVLQRLHRCPRGTWPAGELFFPVSL